jgi:hypothetical protein
MDDLIKALLRYAQAAEEVMTKLPVGIDAVLQWSAIESGALHK